VPGAAIRGVRELTLTGCCGRRGAARGDAHRGTRDGCGPRSEEAAELAVPVGEEPGGGGEGDGAEDEEFVPDDDGDEVEGVCLEEGQAAQFDGEAVVGGVGGRGSRGPEPRGARA